MPEVIPEIQADRLNRAKGRHQSKSALDGYTRRQSSCELDFLYVRASRTAVQIGRKSIVNKALSFFQKANLALLTRISQLQYDVSGIKSDPAPDLHSDGGARRLAFPDPGDIFTIGRCSHLPAA
jgi:hypothetical protein